MLKIQQCTGDLESIIPFERGIYGFVLSSLDIGQIGLPRFGAKNLDAGAIYKSIQKRLVHSSAIIHQRHYSCDISEEDKWPGASVSTKIRLNTEVLFKPLPEKPPADLESLVAIAGLANLILQLSNILYIGSATEQTLRARYSQHYRNYELGKSDRRNFGSRIAAEGLEWSDIGFFSIPLRDLESKDIKGIEASLISISAPIYSQR